MSKIEEYLNFMIKQMVATVSEGVTLMVSDRVNADDDEKKIYVDTLVYTTMSEYGQQGIKALEPTILRMCDKIIADPTRPEDHKETARKTRESILENITSEDSNSRTVH